MVFVVAGNYREVAVRAVVAYVLKQHIVNTTPHRHAIFLVETDADVEQLPPADILHPYILENNIANQHIVAGIDSHTALIVELLLGMVENIDIAVCDVLHGVASGRVAMAAYVDGVCNVGPQYGVFHKHVPGAALVALSRGISRGAVVAVAAEHTVVVHVRA